MKNTLAGTARLSWAYLGPLDTTAAVNEAAEYDTAISGFRYDATGDQSIDNLSTKGWKSGWYQLQIDLGDPVTPSRTVIIGLR